MYYVGLDLHSTKTQVCVINEKDHQIQTRLLKGKNKKGYSPKFSLS